MSENLRLHHEDQELEGTLEIDELELIKKIQKLGELATEIGLQA